MATIRDRLNHLVEVVETRWSLAAHFASGATLVACAGIPAWATWAAGVFSQFAPLSWVIAGACGIMVWSIARVLLSLAYRIRVRARYDERFIDRGGNFNPLDLTFERKRIYLDDFALPSHTTIEGKTFIDCDIIGPACIYFHSNNLANPIRTPKIDAVWLHPTARFLNGFTFFNCIFRNCSFQRITIFASIENYEAWKDLPNINWISVIPKKEDLDARRFVLEEDVKRRGTTLPAVDQTTIVPELLEETKEAPSTTP